jgi:hypothetical protein
MTANDRCPDCGAPLLSDQAIEGLCPQCLLNLAAVPSEPDAARDPDELPTLWSDAINSFRDWGAAAWARSTRRTTSSWAEM